MDQLLPKGWVEEKENDKQKKIEEIKSNYFNKWSLDTQVSNHSHHSHSSNVSNSPEPHHFDQKSKYEKKFGDLVEKEEM